MIHRSFQTLPQLPREILSWSLAGQAGRRPHWSGILYGALLCPYAVLGDDRQSTNSRLTNPKLPQKTAEFEMMADLVSEKTVPEPRLILL